MNTDPAQNHWLQYETGENFLGGLRNTSHARTFCRSFITSRLESGEAKSIIEFGVGGLNERIALDPYLKHHNLEHIYTGTDWTPKFVDGGRLKFPNSSWVVYDVVKGNPLPQNDIGYSQHVLEHCSGLCPALANMLLSSGKWFLNIFFLAPLRNDHDLVNYSKYPMMHNTYSYDHVRKVCDHHGFDAEFIEFDNIDISPDPRFETVLVARRRK